LNINNGVSISNWMLIGLLSTYCFLFTIFYFFFPKLFIVFVFCYIASVAMLLYKCIVIYQRKETKSIAKKFIILSFSIYVGGFFVFWLPERIFCENYQLQRFPFHAIFHVSSSLGPYLWLVFAAFQRLDVLGFRPGIKYWMIGGVPFLPYVNPKGDLED